MSRSKRIYKLIKVLLFGPKSHELLVFCFFLAVSFGFWLLQALNETLDREVQVELQLENVPPEVEIVDSLPRVVSVVLRDRGFVLARHSFSTIFHPNKVKIDFTRFDTGKNDAEVSISLADMQRTLSRDFAASTKVQSFRPDPLTFSYNRGNPRTLPVKLTGNVKASQMHYIQHISIQPDSVLVFAPASILDTMQAVYSEAFLLDELSQTGNHQIELRKQKLVKCKPQQISLKVVVGFYSEKKLTVPVIGLNFPADKKLRTFPAQVIVKFDVESGRYNQITPEDFVLATTYEELLQNEEGSKLQVTLKTIPEGVSNIRISPEKVDYLIEQVSENQ